MDRLRRFRFVFFTLETLYDIKQVTVSMFNVYRIYFCYCCFCCCCADNKHFSCYLLSFNQCTVISIVTIDYSIRKENKRMKYQWGPVHRAALQIFTLLWKFDYQSLHRITVTDLPSSWTRSIVSVCHGHTKNSDAGLLQTKLCNVIECQTMEMECNKKSTQRKLNMQREEWANT